LWISSIVDSATIDDAHYSILFTLIDHTEVSIGVLMKKKSSEKRVFPRIDMECPVLYSVGTTENWQVAMLIDMSATGIKMRCNEQLLHNIKLSIIIKRGQNKSIPAINGKGKVVRCIQLELNQYEVSCNLTEVKNSD
jgi:hypothetical protein